MATMVQSVLPILVISSVSDTTACPWMSALGGITKELLGKCMLASQCGILPYKRAFGLPNPQKADPNHLS